MTSAVGCWVAGCGSSDRPRDLSLDDAQPRELVPTSTLSSIGIAAPPSEGVNGEGTSCYRTPRADISIAAVTNQGVDRWADGSTESFTSAERRRVQGFRTVKVEESGDPAGPRDQCPLYLDVAGGQSLKVDVGQNREGDSPTCEIARQLSDAAVRGLG